MTIRSITAAAAVVFAGLSTTAFAEPKPAVTLAAIAIPATISSAPTVVDDNQRVCVKEELTGSRIPRRECHTRAEWAERGFEMNFGK